MFTLTPGLASSLAPQRRPRTTLSPGLALRDGEPYLAFGTPGGDQQDQWSLAFFLNHVVFGMNLQEAIDFPRVHHQWKPDALGFERGVSPDTLAALTKMGYQPRPASESACVEAIEISAGWLAGGKDGNCPGKAVGF